MLTTLSRAAVLACAVAVSVSAQAPRAGHIDLRFGAFDPLASQLEVPEALRTRASHQLHIVQFDAVPTQADRDAIAAVGGKVIGYLPVHAYVVRMSRDVSSRLQAHPSVRWIGGYQPAFRLDPAMIKAQAWTDLQPVRYNIVVADKHTDKPSLKNNIRAIGGIVDDEHVGSLLFSATLTGPQLLEAAGFDEVLWIDRWSPAEEDMDNARIQGGGNYVESQGGYTGTGVNAHIYEGIEASHPDFTGGATVVRSSNSAQTHGHATGGIVFGNGSSNPAVRGMAPDAGKFFTNYSSVSTSRWQVFSDLVNIHNVSHTTASWGNARTFFYTSVSAESDDITFDHDLAWTQSQSNAGNQDSRPQAWAKNVFSIGGVYHGNNSSASDDSWGGGASIGPASDGRIKPTLTAYYDGIGTSDRTGSSGYSSGSWTGSFGGTSGATPIVAGHNVLAIEMFTEEVSPGVGLFGNQLRTPGGTSHQNRPHFPTLKALQVVSAAQYSFTSSSSNNRREHQGWGFPNLQTMYNNRNKTYIVDETAILNQGQTHVHSVTVAGGEPYFKASLNWNEPAGNPSASQHLINNLSLRVTSPSGTVYWGNNGLSSGLWSSPGGSEDTINSIENVFVSSPAAGVWLVEVIGAAIVQDNHVETSQIDADYGLVVVGGLGQLGGGGTFATKAPVGTGCGGTQVVCDEALYEYPNFDLQNSSITLAYSAGQYTLVPGAGSWITPTGAQGFGDDTEQNFTIPFSLPHPGGTTNTLRVCSNGFVTTGASVSGTNYSPSVAKFLPIEMWCAMWRDLNPSNGGDVYVSSNSQRAVVSWVGVPNYSNSGSNTLQMQFWANGDVHVIYQSITVSGNYLVGYSLANAADPGSVDISANLNGTLTVCNSTAGTPDVALDASSRPVLGSNLSLVTTNVPLTSVGGLQILSLNAIPGGLSLAGLGAPGCFVYQQLDVINSFAVAGGSGSTPLSIPSSTTLIGTKVQAQSGVMVLNINPFNIATSNGLELTIGDI